MEQFPGRRTRSQSPFDEKPKLKVLEEEQPPPRAPFLSDIPIVGKSPFDSTPEKSPSASTHSLNIDESMSNQNQEIDQPSYISPIPPPPPEEPFYMNQNLPNEDDDRMEVCSDDRMEVCSDEGELHSSHMGKF
jgi:hypothetical protein